MPKKSNPGFMKPMQPDTALAEIVGDKPLPRTQIVKKLWEYIKKNKLQDSKDKRNINADATLKTIFNGKSQVTMFKLANYISDHIKKV